MSPSKIPDKSPYGELANHLTKRFCKPKVMLYIIDNRSEYELYKMISVCPLIEAAVF
jgi:hypothetical protein